MIKSLFKIFGLTIIVATFFSCTKDIGKLQQLNAVPAGSVDTCTTNVKYAQQIVPIMNANCAIPTCHVSSGGYIDYSTYTAIKNYLDGGKSAYFNSRIKVGGGMPPSYSAGPQTLSACDIAKLTSWVNAGYPQN